MTKRENGPTWTSPERLYLTKDGKPVGAKDPRKRSVLVAAGGKLPMSRAMELGLVKPEPAAPAPAPAAAPVPAKPAGDEPKAPAAPKAQEKGGKKEKASS